MTAPPAGALEACLALLEKATRGPWVRATSFRGVYSQHPSPGPVQVCRVPENYEWPKQWEANADAMVAAVNFLRTHGPALLAALRLREWCEALVAATHESAAGDMAQCKDEHGAFKSDSHRMAWNFAAGRFEMADDLARVLEQTK